MNYQLHDDNSKTLTIHEAWKSFFPFVKHEWKNAIGSFASILVNAAATIIAPYLLGRAVDVAITNANAGQLTVLGFGLIGTYASIALSGYFNIVLMGRIGQHTLYRLRQALFNKIQSLPTAFFVQNKAGDLISRITNDTNTVNQLFSEILVRLLSSLFSLGGIAVFIIVLNPRLGIATVSVALALFVVTKLSNTLLQRVNKKNLDVIGEYAADVQEQVENMNAIIAFGQREYFVESLEKQNVQVFGAARRAGIINSILSPLYTFAGQIAQVVILIYGIHLLSIGEISIGILISYFAYSNQFFQPLRIIASLWGSFQKAIAGWKRIITVLNMENHMTVIDATASESAPAEKAPLMEFRDVAFGYSDDSMVINDVNFQIHAGKTTAIVGPTGGGKSTIASLMSRLYDPSSGTVFFDGRDIRSYSHDEIAQSIGFILQEPLLFSGTVGENIVFGHPEFATEYSKETAEKHIAANGLGDIVAKFPQGVDTEIIPEQETLSLGEQQLIAFMRAVLRKPRLLILDEATANVDTVTEDMLETILDNIRKDTALVIIAHRLNTIQAADEIMFVQGGTVEQAESFEAAVSRITQSQNPS